MIALIAKQSSRRGVMVQMTIIQVAGFESRFNTLDDPLSRREFLYLQRFLRQATLISNVDKVDVELIRKQIFNICFRSSERIAHLNDAYLVISSSCSQIINDLRVAG